MTVGKPVVQGSSIRTGKRALSHRLSRFAVRVIAWAVFLLGIAVVSYQPVVRPWAMAWGTTSAEFGQSLPGDDLVASPVQQATRAITVNAPADAIWPWLVQMGQGRGGLYIYDWLENLLGCDIHSADAVLPDLQNLKVGDTVRMVPEPFVIAGRVVEGGPTYVVAAIQPNRALVLRPPVEERDPGANYHASWAFVLSPIDSRTTRLIVRSRAYSDPSWVAPVMGVEPIHFFMEQKMMRGIKERAERPYAR